WNEYYILREQIKSNYHYEDLENKLTILADFIVEEAKMALSDFNYDLVESLSNLFYHCQELLMLKYGTTSQKLFPFIDRIKQTTETENSDSKCYKNQKHPFSSKRSFLSMNNIYTPEDEEALQHSIQFAESA
ncbi:MAG: hypothetical protein KGZ62_05460, partial [Sulfurimonas sp.]|nr:hypothetical protein [Sulfurimonas sp.]